MKLHPYFLEKFDTSVSNKAYEIAMTITEELKEGKTFGLIYGQNMFSLGYALASGEIDVYESGIIRDFLFDEFIKVTF